MGIIFLSDIFKYLPKSYKSDDEALWNYMTSIRDFSGLNRYPKPDTKILNSLGFPSCDIKGVKNFAFIGCSYTFGSGINTEDTWGYILSKELGSNYNNFSIPGATLEDCVLLLDFAQKRFNFDHVFFLFPPEHRNLFIVKRDKNRPYLVYNTDTSRYFSHRTNQDFFIKPTWSKDHSSKYKRILKKIEKICNSNYSFAYWHEPIKKDSIKIKISPKDYYNKKLPKVSKYDIGYDGIHVGPNWHYYVAEKMANHYKKNF